MGVESLMIVYKLDIGEKNYVYYWIHRQTIHPLDNMLNINQIGAKFDSTAEERYFGDALYTSYELRVGICVFDQQYSLIKC